MCDVLLFSMKDTKSSSYTGEACLLCLEEARDGLAALGVFYVNSLFFIGKLYKRVVTRNCSIFFVFRRYSDTWFCCYISLATMFKHKDRLILGLINVCHGITKKDIPVIIATHMFKIT